MLRGIDISSHQGQIDWVKVSVSNDFAAIKCTGGLSYLNPIYRQQLDGARSAGLLVLHYAYAHESTVDGTGPREPEDEARHFLAHVDIQPGEIVALDIEDTAIAGDLSGWALRWLRYVEAQTGCLPLIYTYPSYIIEHGLGTTELAAYPLWFAYYRSPERDTPWPVTPGQWESIAIWQWSGGSQVAGIPNPTDQNVSRLTLDQWRGYGKPAPPVLPETKPPAPPVPSDPGTTRAYLAPNGNTIVEVNFGGVATAISGVVVGDVGVSVIGGGGVTYHRTVRDGVFLDWHE